MPSPEKNRLHQLDIIRAFAAFAVCAFHLRGNNALMNEAFKLGYLGVDIFFCLSGFLTPLAFTWGKYHYNKASNFLVGRFFRLYPAFAVIATIEICLYFFGSSLMGYGSHPDRITWGRTLANYTFTADFFDQEWYVPVFWTLAVEAQFYLLIMVIFPLFQHTKKWLAPLTVICMAIGPLLVEKGDSILTYTALFGCGTAVYLYYTKRINYFLMLGLIVLCTVTEIFTVSGYAAYTAAATALAIVHFPQINSRIIKFLSNISYSFFLIHITVGGAICFNYHYLPDTWQSQLLLLLAATFVSTVAAAVFFYVIESPFHKLSRRLKSKKKPTSLTD